MKGDYTRFTFDPQKRFTSVLLQQGRVQLDSDWNELAAIDTHRERTEAIDVIGVRGAPEAGGGFAIESLPTPAGNGDFRITNGRIYVAGLLCELEFEALPIVGFPAANEIKLPAATLDGRALVNGEWLELAADGVAPQFFKVTNVAETTVRLSDAFDDFDPPAENPTARRILTYRTQPELPNAPAPVAGRTDLVYLDVWQRHVTAIEDPEIREEALLGPDTATRIQTMCQVRIEPNRTSCDDIDDLIAEPSGGRLSTRATPGTDDENLCLVPPGGGYTALENRLYRVEIHEGGDIGAATYKWSRYNGAVAFPVARFEATSTDQIWLGSLGEDEVLGLSLGDWVEVLDDETELAGETGTLVRVDGVDQGERSITITPAIPAGTFSVDRHARVRRWDEDVAADGWVKTRPGWNALENGVEIRFTGADFEPGDYWAFAARTNTGRVDVLTEAPPRNVEHHLCPLAVVKWSAAAPPTATVLDDCRPPFVSLVDLLAQRVLRYVAGDGQEGRPGALLQGELIVGVEDGLGRPVEDYDVVFTVRGGGGTLDPGGTSPITDATGPDGLARCRWRLGPDPDVIQEVTAALASTPSPQDESLPVIFRASPYYLSLRYLSGDGQHGRAGEVLPAPLIVGVEDAGGRPVAGAQLSFTAAGGGFVDDAGGTTPTTSTFTTTTDPSGLARADWKLGLDPDVDQRVTVALMQVGPPPAALQDDALELVFEATAHYLSLRYLSGDGQAGRAGAVLPAPLVVGVEDSDGRPVPGITIDFDAGGGGFVGEVGSDPSSSTFSLATASNGTATVAWKLGPDPDDPQRVTAALGGVGPAPSVGQDEALELIFRARPYYLSLRYVTGDGREGRPGDTLSNPPLTVGVEDGEGRPVQGVGVVFTPSGDANVRPPGGTFSNAPITVTTDANGNAQCEMQLGSTEGVYTTTATLDPALAQDESLAVIFRALAEPPGEHGHFPTVTAIDWTNDSPLALAELNNGLTVRFSTKMHQLCLRNKALFVVTVELAERDPTAGHVGFRSHIIHGVLSSTVSGTQWTFKPRPPITPAMLNRWENEYRTRLHVDERVRIRIVLKACGIFSTARKHLDGEAYWAEGPAGVLGTLDRAGDGHEGGDFESWAFLLRPPTPTPSPTPTATIGPTPTATVFPTGTALPTGTVFPTGTVLPTGTLLPTGTVVPTFTPTFLPTAFPIGPGGRLPVDRVEILSAEGRRLDLVEAGEGPTVPADGEPAAIELGLGDLSAEEDAIAFAETLRLVDASSGEAVASALQWLPGNKLRVETDEPLAAGEYVLVPGGDVSAEPTFAFRVA